MKPTFQINADSTDVTDIIKKNFHGLEILDARGLESDTLTLTITDPLNKIAWPQRDVILSVSIGYIGKPLVFKGTFVADEVEHQGAPDLFVIRARAADMMPMSKSLKESVTTHWHKPDTHLFLGDILTKIAAKHGLKASIDAKYFKIDIPHIDQTEESDMHFMSRLAERYDAVGKISNGTLVFTEQGKATAADGRPMPTITINRKQGDRHRHVRKGRLEYGGVKAFWWDLNKAKRMDYLAGSGGGKIKMLKGEFPTQVEATDAANAEFKRITRDSSTMEIFLAKGRPECCAEQKVILTGYRDEMNKEWVSTEVTHTLNASSGFSTRIQLETP